ncbi:ThuA domain-containing protein [Desertivirga xinjiangensis]|uniref:ThuA domain-containing protein n=1 Tax=Desertivirga xinjiangensis TaxID=539206 RepID=UPI00210B4952|nr:ThuA domain-containing protein [Pedobacter xinjiangensis]
MKKSIRSFTYIIGITLTALFLTDNTCQAQHSLLSKKNKFKKSPETKIVLIAGEKSHPAGTHEYIKTVRLIKTMLDNSTKGIKTEVHLHGWPANEKTLEDADLILIVSDGPDGYNFRDSPFLTRERSRIIQKQINRGCGISLLHFSTFSPYAYSQKMLEWAGGYFDWQDSSGNHRKYSEIKAIEAKVNLASPEHPVSRGVKPFQIMEEFYYNIRFSDTVQRFSPILEVPSLNGRPKTGNVIAWTVERKDGGRGFSATINHFYSNWENNDYRKVLLNGIVWASGIEVPSTGVEARFYQDLEVTKHIYNRSIKALLIAERDSSSDEWGKGTLAIKNAIEKDNRFLIDISSNINDLWQYDLSDYKLVILNRENITGINSHSKLALENYLSKGGGLISLAFHNNKTSAATEELNWPAYNQIFRREFTKTKKEPRQRKREVSKLHVTPHFITKNVHDFKLPGIHHYYLAGDMPVTTLLSSKAPSNKSRALAWVYPFKQGRIFQTLLGDDPKWLKSQTVQRIFKNAAIWTSGYE